MDTQGERAEGNEKKKVWKKRGERRREEG